MPQRPQDDRSQDLFKDLNPIQREAVTYGEGPLLIIAGAGTGKTKVITNRIAHLIASKMASPEEILAVTFTEKAANEMEARVDLLIPYTYSFVEISTFNSFGEKVLRDYGIELGYPPDFRLLDDVEQAIFFRENLFKFSLRYFRPLSFPTKHIQELLVAIKKLKQEDVRPGDYLAYAQALQGKALDDVEREEALKQVEVARVYGEYQDLLRKEGKIDFEDQVTLAAEIFRTRPSVLKEFQSKYKYILVDEFQDTNFVQFELLKLLAARHGNLTVVGDDDQSIFRFRGASLSNILNFQEVYPRAKQIVLTRNYRSTQAILDASYQLIRHNDPNRLEFKYRIDKHLVSSLDVREKSIHMLQFDSVSHEADRVADLILEKNGEGVPWGDMAILVRRNADADPYLRALNMKQVPYRFSGSRGLYQQEEIKVLISFIKALTDFEDSRSLFYLALSGVYGMDPYDLTIVSNYAQKRNLPLHKVFRMVHEGARPVELPAAAEAAIKRIFEDLLGFIRLAGQKNAGMVLYAFLEKSGTLKSLVSRMDPASEMKIKNIRLFFDKVKGFSDLADDDSIHSFAGYLDLLQQVGDNPATSEAELDEDAVNVLTVHKAKGLEFSVVFLVSLIEDRYPGRERREKIPVPAGILKEELPGDENFVQEERRLFYVGMTRAKRLLYLTWARDYGLKRLKKVSPFVLEALDIPGMPEEVLRSSALEEIRRFSLREEAGAFPLRKPRGTLTLSFLRLEDYLTCPLKYRFRHILRIPVLPHHALVFGRVLHASVHHFLKNRMKGRTLGEEDVIREYQRLWVNEGYLSREHEELRKRSGEQALRLFYRRETKSGNVPALLEKSFRWQAGKVRFTGRWDRVDFETGGAVIIDFKTTEVKDQKEADRRTRDNLQMDVYALSFLETEGMAPIETRLHFLESDLVGRARKGGKEQERAREKIREAEEGIRAGEFKPRPDWHNCNYCEFKTICPSSYAF